MVDDSAQGERRKVKESRCTSVFLVASALGVLKRKYVAARSGHGGVAGGGGGLSLHKVQMYLAMWYIQT